MSHVKRRRMHTARDRPKVVIVGAGIAGLSVAHELLRTGAFDIEVLEKRARAGGKARTVWQDERFREHSMRILPGSYVCMHQILAEIEAPSGRVIDRLRPSTIRFQKGDLRAVVRGDYSQRFGSFRYVGDAIRLLLFLNRAGVSARELVVFLYKAFSLLFTPERKVIRDLSRLTFAEYVTGGKSSPGFEKVIFRVAEILVAAKSHASAGVVMRTLLEWFVTPFLVGKYVRHQVSEFDSPTSDSLIEPWVDWLEAGGVRFRFGETTTEVLARAGRVKGLRLLGGGGGGDLVEADAYVLAVQHNGADALLPDRLKRYIPDLADFPQLGEEWAHSVQFHIPKLQASLKELGTHSVAVVDSPWSIGYKVYSKSTWSEDYWRERGLDDDAAVLTATISNSNRPGVVHGMPLLRCTKQQILEEVLAQTGLGSVLGVDAGELGLDIEIVRDDEIEEDSPVYSGYAIFAVGGPDENLVFVSDSQMYIRLPGNLDIEPNNATGIFNLFLAGEYTRTNYRIPTMEKSCESGKRCAEDVLEGFGLERDDRRVPTCELPFALLRSEFSHIVMRISLWLAVLGLLIWLVVRSLSIS